MQKLNNRILDFWMKNTLILVVRQILICVGMWINNAFVLIYDPSCPHLSKAFILFQHLKCDDDVYSGHELQELGESSSSQESEFTSLDQGYEADSEFTYDDSKGTCR